MTYGNAFNVNDYPDTPGKHALMQILNSPRIDRERLRQESLAYQKEELARLAESSENKTRCEK